KDGNYTDPVSGVKMHLLRGGKVVDTQTTSASGVAEFEKEIKRGDMGEYAVRAELVEDSVRRYEFSGKSGQTAETDDKIQPSSKHNVHKITFQLDPLFAKLGVRVLRDGDGAPVGGARVDIAKTATANKQTPGPTGLVVFP